MTSIDTTEVSPESAASEAFSEAAAFRDAMARVAGAVHVITTDGPGGRAGFTASAVCSVTDTPPTLLVCLNRASASYPAFDLNGLLCVNTLGSGHQGLAAAFGGRLSREERFAAAEWREGAAGLPVLVGALVAFECRIADRKTVGTHDVFFCEVAGLAAPAEGDALLYANRRYHALSKPYPEPQAASRFEGAVEPHCRPARRAALRLA